MEEKQIKISFGTFICLIIIVILVIAVIGMGMYIVNQNNKPDTENNLNTDNSKENNLSSNQIATNVNDQSIREFDDKVLNISLNNNENVHSYKWYVNEELNWENDVEKYKKSKNALINKDETIKLTMDSSNNYSCIINNSKYYYEIITSEIEMNSYYIDVSDDLSEAYIALIEPIEESEIKIKPFKSYKIEGVKGPIEKIFVAYEGQDNNGIYEKIFLLLGDGTLQFVDCVGALLETGKFTAYECKNVGKITNLYNANMHFPLDGEEYGGAFDWIIRKEDGNYYVWNYSGRFE